MVESGGDRLVTESGKMLTQEAQTTAIKLIQF